jgi:integrase
VTGAKTRKKASWRRVATLGRWCPPKRVSVPRNNGRRIAVSKRRYVKAWQTIRLGRLWRAPLELMRQGKYSPKTVQRRLGHANSGVAMEIYTLVSEDDYMAATLSFDTSAGMAAGIEPNEEDADF